MRNGNWSAAETTYRRLVAQYPYGPYTEQALVETAYAQYKAGKHEDAISSIDRFIRTYPTHRNISYMYYLRGLTNSSRDTVFLQRVWRLDASRRDLATPQQAYNDFSIVADRYPNSRYAADARKRMGELRNMFARHELETALYYLRRTRLCRLRRSARPTCWRPTRRATTRTTPSPRWPRPTRPGQRDAGHRRAPRAAAERAGPPLPARQVARLPGQPAQAQPVRGREVGAGQRLRPARPCSAKTPPEGGVFISGVPLQERRQDGASDVRSRTRW